MVLTLAVFPGQRCIGTMPVGVHDGCRGPRGRRGSESNSGCLRGLVNVGVTLIAIFAMCLPRLIQDTDC